MAKRTIITIGLAAALGVVALPIAANADTTGSATTTVRIAVSTSVSCQSVGNDLEHESDIDMGTLVPGTGTTAPSPLRISGSTNSLNGFTVTGTPTALIQGSGAAAPRFNYYYVQDGVDAPTDNAYWWVTTTETAEGAVTIGETITLTSTTPERTFNLGTNAQSLGTTPAGSYEGTISWVCTVQN